MSEIIKGNIEGVLYRECKAYPDDRGWLMELAKEGGLYIPVKQTTLTVAHPDVIKAFHWHDLQTDLWFGLRGCARAVLVDMREGSQTKGQIDEIILGAPNYVLLLIPPGVAHGYQVLGPEDFWMVYHTDRIYDVNDEHRVDWDKLGFDWKIKHR